MFILNIYNIIFFNTKNQLEFLNNKKKFQIINNLLTFFLKCHNGIKTKKSERKTLIINFKKWKKNESNTFIIKEIKSYLKMLEKVQLNKGKLDYEVRKMKYLNDYFNKIDYI